MLWLELQINLSTIIPWLVLSCLYFIGSIKEAKKKVPIKQIDCNLVIDFSLIDLTSKLQVKSSESLTIQRTVGEFVLSLNFLFSDQFGDRTPLRLPALLCPAGLSSLGGEETDQQREQSPGDRLQRLQAHLLRVSLPGCLHCEEPQEHFPRGAADQGAGGGQQCHRLHCRLHRTRPSKPAHHSGNILLPLLLLLPSPLY